MIETISLAGIMANLRKHLLTILMTTFLGAIISGIITLFIITPQYSSTAKIMVTLPSSELGNMQLLMTSDEVLDTVQADLKTKYQLKMSTDEIGDSLQVNRINDSRFFKVKGIGSSAADAKHIANISVQAFQKYAPRILSTAKVLMVSKAEMPIHRSSPNYKKNLILGLGLGFLFGVAVVVLFDAIDPRIRSKNFVIDELDYPLLGSLPKIKINYTSKSGSSQFSKETTSKSTLSRHSQKRV